MLVKEEPNMENVEKFFALLAGDAGLRQRLREAEANYPGSLEIREAVAEDVLLPVAAELGLPFTLSDLRKYETRQKMASVKPDETPEEGGPIDEDPASYWLLDHGWTYDYEGAAGERQEG